MKVQQKAVVVAGLAYIAMAIFHIPDPLFRHGFDKDAPAQFFALTIIAAVFSTFIALKSHRFRFSKLVTYGAIALVLTQFSSLLMSGDLVGSLIGDAGRFVGTASTVALLAVSIFHSQFKYEAFITLVKFYVVAIEMVVLLGVAQHFGIIDFPGSGGVSSTLGNLDFFAAYVGTTLPLIVLLYLESTKRIRIALAAAALINIYSLYLAGPLQGYLDIAFTALGVLLLIARRYLPRREWTLNARTYLGVAGVVIWAEFIFLMPFLGHFIPVLGDDVQVKIRSNFWLAGMRQFFSHPILGVGPDQYGSYYEQYRTLEDIQKYTNILSNDAHSATVQTLATVGILGTLAFLFLLAVVIRSLLILWDNRTINRRAHFAIGLFIFIYLTNSFVSPITLTHKYLFWAVCGFIVGQVYREPVWQSVKKVSAQTSGLAVASLLLVVAFTFAQAQLNFLNYVEDYAAKRPVNIDYKNTSILPCNMYFEAELLVAKSVNNQEALDLSLSEINAHQRCVSAQIVLTRLVVDSGEMANLRTMVYRLYQLAPARSETLSLGMYYANRTGDLEFKKTLEKTMTALGLIYIPGKLG